MPKTRIISVNRVGFHSTKGVGGGAGLGLSLSKNIIEGHEGSFMIDRTQSYTCFLIELPIAKEVAEEQDLKMVG